MPFKPMAMMAIFFLANSLANAEEFWLELRAPDKQTRNHIVSLGFDIAAVEDGYVVVLASEKQAEFAVQKGLVQASFRTKGISPYSFPVQDLQYHDYNELTQTLQEAAKKNPDIINLESIGKSFENREIWSVRLSATPKPVPGAVFVGGHHAREHVAVEVPLALMDYLITQYRLQNPRIVSLLNTREVFIVPLLNPDGAEFDVITGKYASWRKNRRVNGNSSFGVDLNRNYDWGWGVSGASTFASSDTYLGTAPFSEPETRAFKAFLEQHNRVSVLLSYHTYGKRILWPWSYADGDIPNATDLQVFKNMAQAMAKTTGYIAQKSGDMYLSGGDTCDWAYGAHGIFAFTFELDPLSAYEGGFYPGQTILDSVEKKNIDPALFLMESADNPYKNL